MRGNVISAAEIEKYGYCPLSWWLSRNKANTEQTLPEKKGTKEHEHILREITELQEKESEAKTSEKIVIWFAVIATAIAFTSLSIVPASIKIQFSQILGVIALIWVLAACLFLYISTRTRDGVSLAYSRIVLTFAVIAMIIAVDAVAINLLDPKYMQIILVISLLWLIGSTVFFYRNIQLSNTASHLRDKHKLKGDILYADADKQQQKARLYVSNKYGISGRPDYIVRIGEDIIPVDIKTGRKPRGPLFSHILQIGAYCILIEEEYGKTPQYGVLKYGDTMHEIDFTDELKALVIEKVNHMRGAINTGNVHRNHNRAGKCRMCSRRNVCPEKLA